MSSTEYDVIVAGGGPGGSTVSTLVAKRGYRVLQLEKEKFPRHKIGESLLPATIHGICKMLGVEKEVNNCNFVKKRGGTFRWGTQEEPWTFDFGGSKSTNDIGWSYSFQVERCIFDNILLRNSERSGVEVHEQANVNDLYFENGRCSEVEWIDSKGVSHRSKTAYFVDASGYTSKFYRHVGKRIYSKFFKNVALYGYFSGGKRLAPPNEGNILTVAFDSGWFWYIPLSRQLTSVGVVLDSNQVKTLKNPENIMMECIGKCPLIAEYLDGAELVRDGMYGKFRIRKDYSYCNDKFYDSNIMLVGDAACFVDPVFSSGVHLSTYGALSAARAINSCLGGVLDESFAFKEFQRRYFREYKAFYDFLIAFYDMKQTKDNYFWAARSILNTEERNNDAFVRLVAGANVSSELFFKERSGSGELFSAITKQDNTTHTLKENQRSVDRITIEPHKRARALVLGAQTNDRATEDFFSGDDAGSVRLEKDGLSWVQG